MKVYVVIANNGWDYEGVIGAYTSKEAAEKTPKPNENSSDNWVEEVDLEIDWRDNVLKQRINDILF